MFRKPWPLLLRAISMTSRYDHATYCIGYACARALLLSYREAEVCYKDGHRSSKIKSPENVRWRWKKRCVVTVRSPPPSMYSLYLYAVQFARQLEVNFLTFSLHDYRPHHTLGYVSFLFENCHCAGSPSILVVSQRDHHRPHCQRSQWHWFRSTCWNDPCLVTRACCSKSGAWSSNFYGGVKWSIVGTSSLKVVLKWVLRWI